MGEWINQLWYNHAVDYFLANMRISTNDLTADLSALPTVRQVTVTSDADAKVRKHSEVSG